MQVFNLQFHQRLDLHSQNQVVGHPKFSFGFTDRTSFARCNKKGFVANTTQLGRVPESTPHSGADRPDNRAAQQSPVKEPPNQPKKPPVKEPGKKPARPPSPDEPPVEEPPNEPGKSPVKEPPPEDRDREPPHQPPVRAMPDVLIAIAAPFMVDGFQNVLPGWASSA